MGADMMVAVCEEPYDLNKAKEVIEYRVENLNDNELIHLAENHCWSELEEAMEVKEAELEEGDLYDLDDLRRIVSRSLATEAINQALSEIILGNSTTNYNREIAYVNLKGTNYLITGGMSWGDLPTEASDAIWLLAESGVLDGLGCENFDYDSFKC